MSTPDSQVQCDAEILGGLRTLGGDELVRELITLFLGYAPERLQAARAGLDSGDPMAVRTALHSLKSSAGQLGALTMRDACSRGEDEAGGSHEKAAAALATVEALWPATRDWLIEQQG